MIASPWLLAVTLAVGTVGSVIIFGVAGIILPVVIALFIYFGQKDILGSVHPLYSLFDTQVSLLRASVELMIGDTDGTWDVDAELREAFE
jgi:hypothetical protein